MLFPHGILTDMNIYFSGIGGVAIGPLAQIAHDIGYQVRGSDREPGLMTAELEARGITLAIGQDGEFLRQSHQSQPLDWFVYTAALPENHPELVLARELGIRTAKRDELLAHIITEKNLKLIAVAGTHGKTTTTGMFVWLAKQYGVPVSYSIGTTLSWAASGHYDPESEYFIYECDEFDRNFLHFHPYISLITTLEHDHPDTFPTEESYMEAFRQFSAQSRKVITWRGFEPILNGSGEVSYIDAPNPSIRMPGEHNRRNASLILAALEPLNLPSIKIAEKLDTFPGTNRRFEQLAENLYTDYGHTPTEIAATLQMARELSDEVVLVYQPHQNIRQHTIAHTYSDAIFKDAQTVYWLPTYLSREDPQLAILTPSQLTERLSRVVIADLNQELWDTIELARRDGKLVLCMGAGSIDAWVRSQLKS